MVVMTAAAATSCIWIVGRPLQSQHRRLQQPSRARKQHNTAAARRVVRAHKHHDHDHDHDHNKHTHTHADEHEPEHEGANGHSKTLTTHSHVGSHAPTPTPTHTHTHTHSHSQPHTHSHTHSHPHDEYVPHRRNPPLTRGAGAGLLLFLDANASGLAGDMVVAAMVDLGVPVEVIMEGLSKLGLEGYECEFQGVTRSAIYAPRFVVRETKPQPPRDYAEVRRLISEAAAKDDGLMEGAAKLALDAFQRLAVAEASVHGVEYVDDVHFHEVGAVDSIVDVVAASVALDYLGAGKVAVSPLPVGRGIIRGAAHGPLPNPPPATVSVLCGTGVVTFDAGCDMELVTPTGACLVAAAVSTSGSCTRWPSMRLLRCSYGAGTRDPIDTPNLLRIVLGAPV